MSKPTTIPAHKSKGRPRTFDREAALQSALGVFWRRGYEPASISELCAAMGINPPSLYAAFGNKAQLFMEAVNHYETEFWDDAWERMATGDDIHRDMARFFHEAAGILTSQDAPCGCLVILAATNVSEEGQYVNDALKTLRAEGYDQFFKRINRAVDAGQLGANADVASIAAALNTMLEGMSLRARDGASQDELERVGALAMCMLHGSTAALDA